MSIYDIEVTTIDGQKQTLADYRGEARSAHRQHRQQELTHTPIHRPGRASAASTKNRGFTVLGFPCDQFGHQEPGDETEINSSARPATTFRFPMFAKIEVNGPNAHPLYQLLKSEQPGLLGTEAIKWNFTKFLINRKGEVVNRFAPITTPDKITGDLEHC